VAAIQLPRTLTTIRIQKALSETTIPHTKVMIIISTTNSPVSSSPAEGEVAIAIKSSTVLKWMLMISAFAAPANTWAIGSQTKQTLSLFFSPPSARLRRTKYPERIKVATG
jgi:hypothetical protein